MNWARILGILLAGVGLAGCNMFRFDDDGDGVFVPEIVSGSNTALNQLALVGGWKVRNTPENVNAELILLPEGRLAGNSGVNRIMGSYEADPHRCTIRFVLTGLTLMAGPAPAMEYEQKFIRDLGTITRYELAGITLDLYNGDAAVLSLVRKD